MRRTLLAAGLAGCVALAAAEAAQAQYSFGVGRGGRFGVSVGSPYYSSWGYGGYSPYASGYTYGYPAYSSWYGGSPYIYGRTPILSSTNYNWPYSSAWRYQYPQYPQYGSNYWWSTPGGSTFTYSMPQTTGDGYAQAAPQSSMTTSFYAGPPATVDNDKLLLTVRMPSSDAQLWIDGKPTEQRGFERNFVSPSLDPGTYKYSLKATWNENGREVTREKQVRFQPGRQMTVAFNTTDPTDTPRTDDPARNVDRDFNRPADRQPDVSSPPVPPRTPEADRKQDPTANPPAQKDRPKTDPPQNDRP
jgi:uncharacterized protein (TIGR03000 family)